MNSDEENVAKVIAILMRRKPDIVPYLSATKSLSVLPRTIKSRIIDALGDEFSERGLESNGEPNAYGLQIESLTDAVGLERD